MTLIAAMVLLLRLGRHQLVLIQLSLGTALETNVAKRPASESRLELQLSLHELIVPSSACEQLIM